MAFPVDLVVNPNTKAFNAVILLKGRGVTFVTLLGKIMSTGEIICFSADFTIIKFVFLMLIESLLTSHQRLRRANS